MLMRDKMPCIHKQMVLSHINKLTGELNMLRFRWVIPLDDAVNDASWRNVSVFGSSLLSYSVLLAMPSALPASCPASGSSWLADTQVQPFAVLIYGSQMQLEWSTQSCTAMFCIFTWSLDFTAAREDLCIHLYLESSHCIPAIPTNTHTHTL